MRESNKIFLWFVLLLLLVIGAGCRNVEESVSPSVLANSAFLKHPPSEADSFVEVDCLLPGQVRKLGTMIYTSPRRPAKLTAGECELRGGEYVLYDRGNFKEALAVWMVDAEMGDAAAQTYVGEIYMKSPPENPRYDLAAKWFERAAEQGFRRAQVNLAYLYENGLGVARDSEQSVRWYAKASGVSGEDIVQRQQLSVKERAELAELQRTNSEQSRELARLKSENSQVTALLASLHRDLTIKEREVAGKQEEVNKARQQVAALEGRLTETSGEALSVLQLQISSLQEELTAKEQSLTQQQQAAASLSRQVREYKTDATKYQSTIAELSEKIENLPGPKIEVIDPALLRTRGIIVAPVDSGDAGQLLSGKVWSAAGLEYLKVNGHDTDILDDGLFKTVLRSLDSQKEVKITAKDLNGKTDEIFFTLEEQRRRTQDSAPAASSLGKSGEQVAFGNYYALVIGNNAYRKLPQLQTAVEDARDVSRLLESRYGFKVKLLLNASRHDILFALNEYRKLLTEKDNFLIYYAGHGTLEEKNTQGFWLPVDADPDNDVNWLPTDRVTGIMNLMSAKQILVIADACYSGIMTRASLTSLDAGKSDAAYQKWLAKMAAYKSRVVISSGETKPVLDGGGGKHSVFARALLSVLQENRKVLLGIDLHRAIAERVVQASDRIGYDQVPQYAGLNRAGHELGDFLFVPAYPGG